jgi:hypothetical protein
MQPNFETMTISELKAYALAHRDEVEPLRELYRRRTPDVEAVWYRLPETEEEQQLQQFQQMLSEK